MSGPSHEQIGSYRVPARQSPGYNAIPDPEYRGSEGWALDAEPPYNQPAKYRPTAHHARQNRRRHARSSWRRIALAILAVLIVAVGVVWVGRWQQASADSDGTSQISETTFERIREPAKLRVEAGRGDER